MRGRFITFEGPDGSGKSTQISMLGDYLRSRGLDPVITREPGGTEISELIRTLLLDVENTAMSPMTETLLYAAARAQHVDQLIRPALEAGRLVISDRYIDSSIAYQGYGRGLGAVVAQVNDIAVRDCVPNLTFLLKLEPSKGLNRVTKRDRIESEGMDRIEREGMDYHNQVWDAYAEIEKRWADRIIGIDGTQEPMRIHELIKAKTAELLDEDQ
jgi:dTMP kinase